MRNEEVLIAELVTEFIDTYEFCEKYNLDKKHVLSHLIIGFTKQTIRETKDGLLGEVTQNADKDNRLLGDFDMPTMVVNFLRKSGISTVGQLQNTQHKDLLKIRGIAGTSAKRLEEFKKTLVFNTEIK